MCGIVSIFNLREQTPELRQKALRMSRKIRHRGPDWSGIYCGGSAILAHERLSIVDPESGGQPLFSPDGKQVLAVNGEIYNHQNIREHYHGKYEFQTGSDCEVILALYRDKGIQRLRKAYSSGKISKKNVNQRGYNKFLIIENDVLVSINEEKIADDAKWDGLKSYVTNTELPPADVISQYHGLWVVERAFRITKGTLEARPIFHFTERRIEAHICICFVAYKLYKELERILRILRIELSVDKVLDIAKTISTVTIKTESGSEIKKTIITRDEQRLLLDLLPNWVSQ